VYYDGSPWTADAASHIAADSLDYHDAARGGHDLSGPHKAPQIAKIAAVVLWTGAAYTLTAGYGVASIARNSAGNVTLTLDTAFVANRWGARVEAGASDAVHMGVYTTPSETGTLTIQMVSKAGVAADVSFWAEAWGVL
jgi:hypothetical protein